MKYLLIVPLGLLLIMILMVGGVALFLSTESGQQWLYDKGLQTLQETLHTRVAVERISIHLLKGEIELDKLQVDDRQGVQMLSVDTLQAKFDLRHIFQREIGLRNIRMSNATAVLYKERPDTAANYQFVIDEMRARKKNKTPEEKKEKSSFRFVADTLVAEVCRTNVSWDVRSATPKPEGKVDVSHIKLKDFSATLCCNLEKDSAKSYTLKNAEIHELHSNMHLYLDKALVRNKAQRTNATAGIYDMEVSIDSLRYKYDNHRPRKNTGKPHRGWFDPGHVTIVMNVDAYVHKIDSSGLSATVNKLAFLEKESHLDIKNMRTDVNLIKDTLRLSNTKINLAHTQVNIKEIKAQLLHDKLRAFRLIDDCTVTASVVLKDIAYPFGIPLKNFTTPLRLSVGVGGDLKRLLFKNIRVSTPDGRLHVSGNGDLCNTLEKKALCLHFNNIYMSARNGIKEQIVNHFAKQVRLKMIKQLAALGDVTYNGHLGVFFKRIDVGGTLRAIYGSVSFNFSLNGYTHYMTGTMSTDEIDLGSIMNVKGLSIENAKASYSFNISSKRGRPNGGRLPQGWLKANVNGARFKFLHFNDISADIVSNGVDATGDIIAKAKLADVICGVIYHQTDKDQYFRVKPKFKLNKKTKEKMEGKKTETPDSEKVKKPSLFKRLFGKKKKDEQ